MSFKTSLVDIDKITSVVPRSNFSEAELEKLARLILDLNGIVKPLVVQEITREKYQVLEGDFQFYGALRAWEINDDFEMIRAFIVNSQEQELVKQQLNLLAKTLSQKDNHSSSTHNIRNPQEHLEKRIDNLEARLNQVTENSAQNLQQLTQEIDSKFKKINQQLPSKLELLSAFNELSLENLSYPLSSAGIKDQEVTKIIDFISQERKKKPFTSLVDLMARSTITQGRKKVRLITEKKLIKIMDSWSKTAFYL